MLRKKSIVKEKKPTEGKIEEKEIEKLIIELAKSGMTSEKIGQQLKDKHNVKPKASGIKISKILQKHNLYKNADIENLKKRVENLKKHLSKNKHDYKTKRILSIKEAKLKKLIRYKEK